MNTDALPKNADDYGKQNKLGIFNRQNVVGLTLQDSGMHTIVPSKMEIENQLKTSIENPLKDRFYTDHSRSLQ